MRKGLLPAHNPSFVQLEKIKELILNVLPLSLRPIPFLSKSCSKTQREVRSRCWWLLATLLQSARPRAVLFHCKLAVSGSKSHSLASLERLRCVTSSTRTRSARVAFMPAPAHGRMKIRKKNSVLRIIALKPYYILLMKRLVKAMKGEYEQVLLNSLEQSSHKGPILSVTRNRLELGST